MIITEFLVYLNNYKDGSSFTHFSHAPVVGAAWKVTWPGLALHFGATVARSQGTVVVNVSTLASAPCVWSLHMIWLPAPLCFTVLTCSPLSLELLRMLRLLMEGLLTQRISLPGANRPRGLGNPFQRRSYRCRQAPLCQSPSRERRGSTPQERRGPSREKDQSFPEAKKQSPSKEKVKVKERSSKKHCASLHVIASLSVTLNGNGIKSETVVGITVRTGIGLRSATMIAIMSVTRSIIATLVLTGITTPVTAPPQTPLLIIEFSLKISTPSFCLEGLWF